MRARRRRSRSDVVIAIGAPIVGAIGIAVGVATGDTATAIFGGVAVVLGLVFTIPLLRGGNEDGAGDGDGG